MDSRAIMDMRTRRLLLLAPAAESDLRRQPLFAEGAESGEIARTRIAEPPPSRSVVTILAD